VRPFGDLGGAAVRRRADLLGLRLGEAQHPLGPGAESGVGRADPGPDDPDLLLDGDRVLLGHRPAALAVRERGLQRCQGLGQQLDVRVDGVGRVAPADGREIGWSEVTQGDGGSRHSRSGRERAVVVHRPEYRRVGDRCHALVE